MLDYILRWKSRRLSDAPRDRMYHCDVTYGSERAASHQRSAAAPLGSSWTLLEPRDNLEVWGQMVLLHSDKVLNVVSRRDCRRTIAASKSNLKIKRYRYILSQGPECRLSLSFSSTLSPRLNEAGLCLAFGFLHRRCHVVNL